MKKIEMRKLKFVSPLLLWTIVAFGIITILYFFPSKRLFATNYLTTILSIFFIFYWIFFISWSFKFHRQAPLSVAKIKIIIKNGPYKFVRHPMYSADIIAGIGIFLIFPSFRVFFGLLWLIFILTFWMRLEEKSLIKKFGLEYENYMKQTGMFIPKLWLKHN